MIKNIITIVIFSFLTTLQASASDFGGIDVPKIKKEDGKQSTYKDLIRALIISNDPQNLIYLGVLYANGVSDPDINGNTIPVSPEKTVKYLKKAGDMGKPEAYGMLGFFLAENINFIKIPNHKNLAIEYLNKAFNNGIYNVGSELANLILLEKKNARKAMKILYTASKHNQASAQLMLALIYKNGIVEKGKCAIKKELYNEVDDYIVPPTIDLAEKFLTMACLNPQKGKAVKTFCAQNTYQEKKEE